MIELKTQVGGFWRFTAIKPDGTRRVLAEFEETAPKQDLSQAVRAASQVMGDRK